MNELVREIEEDIRRERLDRLWHGFGKVMVAVSIAVILATVGVVIVQERKQAREMDKTTQLIKGIDRLNIEDYKGAIPIFEELAKDETSPYYGLAMLRKAQAEIALGEQEEARKTYAALAAHDAVFGPLGQVLVYGGTVSAGETLPAPGKQSPLYYTQSEFRGWQLLQQGRKEDAVAVFLSLYQDSGTPGSMHERMLEVLQHIAPEKLTQKTLEGKDATHE